MSPSGPGRTLVSFSTSIDDRYFEDYVEGEVHRFGSIAVEFEEIVAFANRFDPQSFHTDVEAAKKTPFGEIIASGWHTAGLMMRLLVQHYLSHVASLGSPGIDEIRWPSSPCWRQPFLTSNCAQGRAVEVQTGPRCDHLVHRSSQSGQRDRNDH